MSFPSLDPVKPRARAPSADFDKVYAEHAGFVWTNARRLGVPESGLDDVVQEVFLVVHRRLGDFAGGSSMKTWVCGILMNVVRQQRRRFRRKEGKGEPESASQLEATGGRPDDQAEAAEALRMVHDVLAQMSEAKREAIVLSQLEGMSVPEIAAATGDNENTIYARVRAARREFEEILQGTRGEGERAP